MIRPTSLILLALSAAAGGALFHVAFDVSNLEDRLAALNKDIRADREAIHVLRAEWSFLNQPGRIEELSRRYLELAPLEGEQFAPADAVPVRLEGPEDDGPSAPAPDSPGSADSLVVPVAVGAPRAKPAPPARPSRSAATQPASVQPRAEDERSLDDVLREITAEQRP